MMSGSVGGGSVVVPTPGGSVAGGTPAIVVVGAAVGGAVGAAVGAGVVGRVVGGSVGGGVTGMVAGSSVDAGRTTVVGAGSVVGGATVVGDGKRSSSRAMASPASRRLIDQAMIPAITTSASTATMTKPRRSGPSPGPAGSLGCCAGGAGCTASSTRPPRTGAAEPTLRRSTDRGNPLHGAEAAEAGRIEQGSRLGATAAHAQRGEVGRAAAAATPADPRDQLVDAPPAQELRLVRAASGAGSWSRATSTVMSWVPGSTRGWLPRSWSR